MSNQVNPSEQNPPQALIRLKRGVYQFRITDAEKTKTQKTGDSMLVLTCEVINHPPITIGDREVNVNGIEITDYKVLTDKTLPYVNLLHRALGMPEIQAHEISLVEASAYKGADFYAVAESKDEPMLDEDKNPMMNPHTGQPLMLSKRKFVSFIER